MAHFTGKQLITFLSLLAAGNINKDPKHDTTKDIGVATLPPGGYPPHIVSNEDPKIDFIRADNCPGRGECSPYTISVSRMDMRGQILEYHGIAARHAPQVKRAIIHRQFVGVDIPGPEGHTRGLDSKPKVVSVPDDIFGMVVRHDGTSSGRSIFTIEDECQAPGAADLIRCPVICSGARHDWST